ncbi:MAG: 2,3-bisphosphoglycerate-independent phosphoglycerate mutase [Elusimicrobia bacterium]|nr:2,3-bisphosphoglycerate-independent phosphoglycerate mutase [Candidatus Liberimonas magnetica]
MITQEFLKKLVTTNENKIVMLVFDGLGGLPNETGKTELESAKHPNLDKFIENGICGFSDPIAPGITPGSGPAHVALFGYNPLEHEIGRGLLDTLGIDFDFTKQDLAARGNFATCDKNGIITDRRAGRIASDKSARFCNEILKDIVIEGIKTFVLPVKEHRFSVIFRGEGLSDKLADTDPQKEGLKALPVKNLDKNAEFSAKIVTKFIQIANDRLKNEQPANTVLLRGFSKMIDIPQFTDTYQLKSAAIALYPMYRGLARLVGMEVLKTGTTIESEFQTLKENFNKYDFFFIHIKQTDSSGEDGDFSRKVKAIEEADASIKTLVELNPSVVVVTGDHSTPAVWHGHSWHPVPLMISAKFCRKDNSKSFNEKECITGGLGRISAQSIMALALANAGKLNKYGA